MLVFFMESNLHFMAEMLFSNAFLKIEMILHYWTDPFEDWMYFSITNKDKTPFLVSATKLALVAIIAVKLNIWSRSTSG